MNSGGERLIQGALPDPDPLGGRPLYYNDAGQPVFPSTRTSYDEERDRASEEFDRNRLNMPPAGLGGTVRIMNFVDKSAGMRDANDRARRR